MSEKQERVGGMCSAGEASPLSPQRAVVVQCRTATEQTLGDFAGRVGHLTSGQAARFS
jgi:hypothetical protein